MSGDVDNIVKPIQDALVRVLYVDDNIIRRVVAQRFLPFEVATLSPVPALLARALATDPPFVYIRISGDPLGEAQ
ncbi:RusA family crossover junction endodeoxyribonuclease [Pseudoroseicyclus sp. CXY001]|uniref:RusA family crossover junction endodeoxyribonuclease n=1 Tax=Pseudoroseicyclus sp. CXY001 TaxID=3242492 RepID=UPI00358DA75A